MSNKHDKYNTILNNLLDVQPNDSSIFTKIDNNNFFDLKNMLSDDEFESILNSEKFEITLLDGVLLEFKKQIENSSSIEELRDIVFNKNTRKIPLKRFIESKNDFPEIKRNILNIVEHKIQNSVSLWKSLDSNANSILEETNIWPLYIGFIFTSLKIEEKIIYAPLFLKEVFIKFKNGKPFLTSEGEIKINEKIMFFLKNNGIDLHIDSNLNEQKMKSIVEILKSDWENLYRLPEDVFSDFQVKGSGEIDNENIVFHSGAVLGIFQPTGGYSRNRMKEIIEKDEIDTIINVEINKNVYWDTIKKHINNPKISIFKITPSNLSQDKAVISALNQHTIIWGPPGTGKSQTIVNLITNILVYNKTAIVASQKKAALDVIKDRLGSLRDFCLFMLKSKNVNKKRFYEPIRNYLDLLEGFNDPVKSQSTPIISSNEIKYLELVNDILNNDSIQNILRAYYYLSKYRKNPNYSGDIEFLINLPSDISYPENKLSDEDIVKAMIKENGLKFMIFLSKYRKVKKVGEDIKNNFAQFDGNFSDLVSFFHEIAKNEFNGEIINKINKLIELSNEIDFQQMISDEKIIHKIILERINDKFKQMTEAEKKEYQDFAQHVRIENLEPYRFVKKFAKIIKIIFPIIVATPDTDLSPWSKEELDYAIMDESSQIFIEKGLPILYLAKKKVLAGDPEQMRPSNWFGTRSTDDTIFGQVDSLLDYASSLNVTQILLDKNYRSNHAALMSFSSKHFYKSQLDVVDANEEFGSEPLEVFEVDGVWKDSKNEAEALKAIELLQQNLDKYKKIILLAFNISQSEYINSLILNKYPDLEEAIHSKKLLIKNIENIQGDEADLVIATISYDKQTKLSSTYICRPGGRNALNVAVSRAKDKMIVIKTINSSDIQLSGTHTDDLETFKEWLRFLEKSNEEKRKEVYDSFNKTGESVDDKKLFSFKTFDKSDYNFDQNSIWFRDLVKKIILNSIKNKDGFELFENYNVGSINIDLVVTKNQKPYKSFIFDMLSYDSNEKYMKIRDRYRFLVSKKYDVEIITPISWITQQNKINDWFGVLENESKNIASFQPTSSYILNKSNNEQFHNKENLTGINELENIKENAEKNISKVLNNSEETSTITSNQQYKTTHVTTKTQVSSFFGFDSNDKNELDSKIEEVVIQENIKDEEVIQENYFSENENNVVNTDEEKESEIKIENLQDEISEVDEELEDVSSLVYPSKITSDIEDEYLFEEKDEEDDSQVSTNIQNREHEYFDFNYENQENKKDVSQNNDLLNDEELNEIGHSTDSLINKDDLMSELKNIIKNHDDNEFNDDLLNQEEDLESNNEELSENSEKDKRSIDMEITKYETDELDQNEVEEEYEIPNFKIYENKNEFTSTWLLNDEDFTEINDEKK
ncbi:putative ATP-dependent helicase [Mycoplasmopsis canis UF31]|uniref:AAA domain-containing protein n=1 Tax=Mycoplasmopsis canis TaxID=29555 RepID=UPI00025AE9FB|nr:AAA domain-containing protein [Mycoplasmopsis canis]EIE40128.1 putative ATP-dependent helicase [Mycoplasmopsis canis UF31]